MKLHLSELCQGNLDIFTLESFSCLSIIPQLLRVLLKHLSLVRTGFMIVGVNEDTFQIPSQLVFFSQDPIKLRSPELFSDCWICGHSDSLSLITMVPMCSL